MDDVDFDIIPPAGISVIGTNTTVTVRNNPVEISEETGGTSSSDTEGSGTETPTTTVILKEQRVQTVTGTVMAAKVQQPILDLMNRGRPYLIEIVLSF